MKAIMLLRKQTKEFQKDSILVGSINGVNCLKVKNQSVFKKVLEIRKLDLADDLMLTFSCDKDYPVPSSQGLQELPPPPKGYMPEGLVFFDNIPSVKFVLYADDLAIWTEGTCPETCKPKLQGAIDKLSIWLNKKIFFFYPKNYWHSFL